MLEIWSDEATKAPGHAPAKIVLKCPMYVSKCVYAGGETGCTRRTSTASDSGSAEGGISVTQSKGVLPTRAEDREVLYANPRTCGYFIGVRLGSLTVEALRSWFTTVDLAVNALVSRLPAEPASAPNVVAKGEKVAAVAIGLASRIFGLLGTGLGPDAAPLETPVGLRSDATPLSGWFPGIPAHPADVLFYVASTREARVNEFIAAINTPGIVESLTMDRAYQRADHTEPFGYIDGRRNVDKIRRSHVAFVHTDKGQPDEPAWADGGTYMVSMRILQNQTSFAALPDDAARDAIIGRTKDGARLDLGPDVHPHVESSAWAETVPGNAHVRKAGPRGRHDDTEIFRRGMPFLDVTPAGVQVGLHFCSFQANPAQFDTVFNDWMMNQTFPARADGSSVGADALMTPGPTGPLTQVLHAGLYFVPPHHPDGLNAALKPTPPGKPTHARLAITKRVVDPSNPSARFERGGFTFHVQDDAGVIVEGSEFTTLSSGRGVCPVELEIGKPYVLVETVTPPGIPLTLAQVPFTLERPNTHLAIDNTLTQPSTGYGGA